MKVFKNIFIFIFEFVLAISLIAIMITNLVSSSILNKNYVLGKFDEIDYYHKIYEYAKSNFEKYTQQSGLDEAIMENLITEEQVKSDTQKIINNIFDGNSEKITSDDVEQKLKDNIKVAFGEIPAQQQEAIDDFIETIGKEYLESISHYKYEDGINKQYVKIEKYIKLAKIASVIGIILSVILLFLLNLKEKYKFWAHIGVSSIACGAFLILLNKYINVKINVQSIVLLNSAFSEGLINVLNEILNIVKRNGIVFVIIGFFLNIIPIFIQNMKKDTEEEKS